MASVVAECVADSLAMPRVCPAPMGWEFRGRASGEQELDSLLLAAFRDHGWFMGHVFEVTASSAVFGI